MVNHDNPIIETADKLSIPDILAAFSTFDGIYKREHIDAAILQKQEITPRLIEILENLLADPEKYAEDEMLYDHIYAVMLLGHFKEPKAHQVIIDLFSLPGDMPDQLFGDICTSDLSMILFNTCGGDVDSIHSMILNRKADDYCRASAFQALAYAVVEGCFPREKALAFFNTLFTGEEAEKTSDFWGFLAMTIYDLYPEESMEVIRQAYQDKLISPGMIAFSDFKKALSIGKDKCLEKIKRDFARYSLDDIHASMSWWSCFKEENDAAKASGIAENGSFSGYADRSDCQSPKNEKKNKKKKRKQAKASKKKNRR